MTLELPNIRHLISQEGHEATKNRHFIVNESAFLLGEGVYLYACRYDQSVYSDDLFIYYDIHFSNGLEKAINSRKSEFLAGRYVAKKAMVTGGFQLDTYHVGIGGDRSPNWPINVLGSITHSNQLAICVVESSVLSESRYLGVDLETVLTESMAVDIENVVCSKREIEIITRTGVSRECALTIIFSAKESLFKAIYPFVEEYFGFEEAQVYSIDSDGKTVYFKLSSELCVKSGFDQKIDCQYSVQGSMVVTLVSGHLNHK